MRLVAGADADAARPAPVATPSERARADAELLEAVRRGDPGAATAFHDRVRPQVDRTIRRLLGARDVDHDDIAQLALLELVTTIDRYRGDCSLDSWAGTIAAHVVYKHLRRRKFERRLFGALDADWPGEAPSQRRVGRDMHVRSALRQVIAVLESVDPAKASAFVLHDVFGYDVREVAQITGASESATQTRLVRGRREVHERIAADPELARLVESIEGET